MARRRFQRGSVFLRGKREPVWVGRWREDVITVDGQTKRVLCKEFLGTKKDFPTKKLALREMESRIAPINNTSYRAMRTATFAEFCQLWQKNALSQHKQSTQASINSQIKCHLVPYFGKYQMRDITPQLLQMFICNCQREAKTVKNLVLSLRMIWKSAKAWGYVNHKPFEDLTLPKRPRTAPFFFTLDEACESSRKPMSLSEPSTG